MDLDKKELLLNEWENRLIQWEKELNEKEKQNKLGLAFINSNVKYLNENYNEYPDIDTQQIESISGHLYH
jgi:hypothetical protein